jgi:glycosyltransferase involved in cell wall biosynthesis
VPFVVRDGETALLVAAGDDAAMAEALMSVIEDDDRAWRLVEAGLELVRQYDWASVHAALAEQYRRAAPLARSVSHA